MHNTANRQPHNLVPVLNRSAAHSWRQCCRSWHMLAALLNALAVTGTCCLTCSPASCQITVCSKVATTLQPLGLELRAAIRCAFSRTAGMLQHLLCAHSAKFARVYGVAKSGCGPTPLRLRGSGLHCTGAMLQHQHQCRAADTHHKRPVQYQCPQGQPTADTMWDKLPRGVCSTVHFVLR